MYRRNPPSLDFIIDYWAMVDALQKMIDAAELAGTPLPIEYYNLYMKLNRIGPHLRVEDFARIFSETITPPGEEPTFTNVYHLISVAQQSPSDPIHAAVLDFVTKIRRIIQIFDRAKARDVQQLTFTLLDMRNFVITMLDEVYAHQVQLDASALEALSNMERWKSSMGLLNASNLSLATLNEFIRQLQPSQPFGMSVYLLYQEIDPSIAQTKALEFMDIINRISNIINPFTPELAANDQLTGWKYLHVPAEQP